MSDSASTPHQAPTSQAEYEDTIARNQKISGVGFDTTSHLPCPFCAAPDFLVSKIGNIQGALVKGATCSVCGRSAKTLVSSEDGQDTYELVQTGGPDQPDWLRDKARRVNLG